MGHGFIVFLGYLGSFPGAWKRGYRILQWRAWQPCHKRMIHGLAMDSLYSRVTLLEGLATMPSTDDPWMGHCIPGILYWRAWQPCHPRTIHGWHGIPGILYWRAWQPCYPWTIHGWAMVFLGYFTGGPDNHAIHG